MARTHLFICLVLAFCMAIWVHSRETPALRNLQGVNAGVLIWCDPHPACNTPTCGKYTGNSCERKTKDGFFVCWDQALGLGPSATICDTPTMCYDYPRVDLRCSRTYTGNP